MFDSSKCPKAEAFLVSTETTLAAKKKKKVFRSISELKTRSSSLPRSYPHVFPSQYPTSEMSVAHRYTVRISSASPRGLRTDAHLGGASFSTAARAPASRLSAADRCCALLCLCATLEGRVSRQHFQSVLTRPAAPFPSLLISHPSDSLLPAPEEGAWPHLAQPRAFPRIARLQSFLSPHVNFNIYLESSYFPLKALNLNVDSGCIVF